MGFFGRVGNLARGKWNLVTRTDPSAPERDAALDREPAPRPPATRAPPARPATPAPEAKQPERDEFGNVKRTL